MNVRKFMLLCWYDNCRRRFLEVFIILSRVLCLLFYYVQSVNDKIYKNIISPFSCDVHLSPHPFPLFFSSVLDGCEQSFLCFDRWTLRENSCGIHEAEDRRVPGPAFMCWWSGNAFPFRKSNSFRPDLRESLSVLNRIRSVRIDSDSARYCESRSTSFSVQNMFLVFIMTHVLSQVVSRRVVSSPVVPSRVQSIRYVPSLEYCQVESSQVDSSRVHTIVILKQIR